MTGGINRAPHTYAFAGVIWICGLAGSGKTTLAGALTSALSDDVANLLLIDGDTFRKVYMPHAGYSRDERLRVAHAIHNEAWQKAVCGTLCVVATISLFHEIHGANRAASARFKLPFFISLIDTPKYLRDIRRPSLSSHNLHVVGADIPAEFPNTVDHHYINNSSLDALTAQALAIRQQWISGTTNAQRS
jgi:cytidine diphosphoramidate kinase